MRHLLVLALAFSAMTAPQKEVACSVVCPREVARAVGGSMDKKHGCLCEVPIDLETALAPTFPIDPPIVRKEGIVDSSGDYGSETYGGWRY